MFTVTYGNPQLGALGLPIFQSMKVMINAGLGKAKRESLKESPDLPEPKETRTAGMSCLEFYGEKGLKEELERGLHLTLIKNRKLSPYIKKLDLLKTMGLQWTLEELEEWKPPTNAQASEVV